MKVLVLDIGSERVLAGAFESGKPLSFVSASIEGPGDDGLREALSEVLDQADLKKGRAFGRVLVSLPPSELIIRVVEMPFSERKKVLEALPFELAGLLHVEVGDVVMDAVPLGAGRFLAVAAERRLVRGYLEILSSMGIDPCWMGSGLFAADALISASGAEGARAVVVPGAFAVVEDGSPRLFKPVRGIENVHLAAEFLDAEGITVDEVHSAGWDAGELAEIFHGARQTPLELPAGCPPEASLAFALAVIEDSGRLAEMVNFRRGEFEYTREKAAKRRGLKTAALLASVLVLLLAGDLYARYMGLSAELDSYNEALRSQYAGLFPGERAAADPVYQLETRLRGMEKEIAAMGGGGGSLDALLRIAEAVPDGAGIKITEIVLGPEGRVVASGEATTFEDANRLKEALSRGPLKDVSLDETKARPGGGTSFSMNAYLR
ncbi:MAG: hypothetical protein H3C68_01210 [Deltaproteobacteria bacterium]|nr:hypothetical protein [Deltaproteobacteria bacterium]MBZ0219127.1 hypothetical protein [Deltaproteobacteria bacterium]